MPQTVIEIPLELGQALLNYLQGKPYIEVHQLIGALMQAQQKTISDPTKDGE